MKRRRLLLLSLIGILLVAGALAYRRFRFARPVGEGPAGPLVPREPFAQPWTDRQVLLLAAGDSVTAGYGVRQSHSYVGRLAENRPNVYLVPMHDEFLGHGIHCTEFWRKHYRPKDPHYWYGSNLEDPNERGYDAIRRLFLLEIAKAAVTFRKAPVPVASGAGQRTE